MNCCSSQRLPPALPPGLALLPCVLLPDWPHLVICPPPRGSTPPLRSWGLGLGRSQPGPVLLPRLLQEGGGGEAPPALRALLLLRFLSKALLSGPQFPHLRGGRRSWGLVAVTFCEYDSGRRAAHGARSRLLSLPVPPAPCPPPPRPPAPPPPPSCCPSWSASPALTHSCPERCSLCSSPSPTPSSWTVCSGLRARGWLCVRPRPPRCAGGRRHQPCFTDGTRRVRGTGPSVGLPSARGWEALEPRVGGCADALSPTPCPRVSCGSVGALAPRQPGEPAGQATRERGAVTPWPLPET